MKIVNNINQNIFREYDIRGIYETDLNEDVSYTLGRSIGSYIRQMGEVKTIIGHDNRESYKILYPALLKGITDSGVDVINLNMVTTPMYYFARKHMNINTGIMLTASHNPKDYNGYKIAFNPISNAYGKYIYDFRDYTNNLEFVKGNGTVKEYDIFDEYLKEIRKNIKIDKKIRIGIDCGNGTGSLYIKKILDEVGNIEYYPLYCESDSNFPNHIPDPSVESNMEDLKKLVQKEKLDLGIGIDGDADRVGIVLENGKYVSADMYMIIIFRNIVNKMKNKKGLFDVKCSKALIDELNKLGIEPCMNRTGNSYQALKMHEGNFDFGGEFSGHVFFSDKWIGTDDGIYAGLRLIEILSQTDKKVSELLDGINKYYSTEEIKFNAGDDIKFDIVKKVVEYARKKGYNLNTIDGVRVEFDNGFALVRASNTGPNITARFEANNKNDLEKYKNEFEDIVNKYIGEAC